MNRNKLLGILLVVTVIVQLWFPVQMILQVKKVEDEGSVHKFKIRPIDPEDPFRGKYLALRFYNSSFQMDTTQNWERGEKVFVTFKNDSSGFSIIKDVIKEKPEGESDYLMTTVKWAYSRKGKHNYRIDFPFDRYYINEDKAPKIEAKYNAMLNDSLTVCWAEVSLYNGRAVLNNILVNGLPLDSLMIKE